jgi:hypothetical protein
MNTEPIGAEPSRADVLGRLKRERWHAANNGETAQVAALDARIAALSAQNSATAPTRETAAAAPVRRQTAARTNPKTTSTKGNRRVAR